jgi:hypothetical protein
VKPHPAPDDLAEAAAGEEPAAAPDVAELGPPPHPRPDPQALDDSAERLGAQLDRAAAGPADGPPTLEEVIELFGGTLLPEEP